MDIPNSNIDPFGGPNFGFQNDVPNFKDLPIRKSN
jgi:hypothetical protein